MHKSQSKGEKIGTSIIKFYNSFPLKSHISHKKVILKIMILKTINLNLLLGYSNDNLINLYYQ
jgi:hypothetical protein